MPSRISGLIDRIVDERVIYDGLLSDLTNRVTACSVLLDVMGCLVKTCAFFTRLIHIEEELMYLTKHHIWSRHNTDHGNIISGMVLMIERRHPIYYEHFSNLRDKISQHADGYDLPLMSHAKSCIQASPRLQNSACLCT